MSSSLGFWAGLATGDSDHCDVVEADTIFGMHVFAVEEQEVAAVHLKSDRLAEMLLSHRAVAAVVRNLATPLCWK